MSDVHANATAPSFFDLYSSGRVSQDELDDFVGRWHQRFKDQSGYPPLHEYLGLTREEYELLMADPFALPCILRAREGGEDIADIMAERYATLRRGNRREDATIVFALGNWLQRRSGQNC
jgi:hypothetical protein